MKLRTNKRIASERKQLAPRLLHIGRIQQQRKAKSGSVLGVGSGKSSKKDKDSREDPAAVSTEYGNEHAAAKGFMKKAGASTRRSAIRSNNNACPLELSHPQEEPKEFVRVLRSRNLNCSLFADTKGKSKAKVEIVNEAEVGGARRQQQKLRFTRSSAPVASASRTPEEEPSALVRKVQIKTAVLEEEEAEEQVASSKESGLGVRFKPRKRRRRRRKSVISTVKTRRSSGSSLSKTKNGKCVEPEATMHEDVAPETVSSSPGDVDTAEVVAEVSKDPQSNAHQDSISQESIIDNSDSSDSSTNSSSCSGSSNEDAEGITAASLAFNEAASDPSSPTFNLDDYSSHQVDYCNPDLFRDEYCPNGVSPANPFGLPSVVSPLVTGSSLQN
ncbi:hypothetical protein Ocin01_01783, partial [Orchesella cincta]